MFTQYSGLFLIIYFKYNKLNTKGFSLNLVERYDEALVAYDRAIQLDPSYAYAHNNKGLTLNNMNKHESAIRCFDIALKLKPNFLEAV